MNDEKFNTEKFPIIEKLFSELTGMQHDLIGGDKLKVEYEKELSYRKQIEEEANKVKASLEEELVRSRAEVQRITEELQSCVMTMGKLHQSIDQINSITKSVQTAAGIDVDKP